MVLLLQAVADGVLLGLLYTVMAVGLSLTLGVLGIVNVAHGTFVVLGSFFALGALRVLGWDPLVSVVAALPVFFLAGAVVDRVLIRRVARAPQLLGLLVLFGVMVAVESAAILLWTTDTRVITVPYTNRALHLGAITLSEVRLIGGGIALLLVVLLHAGLRLTRFGKAIRAMAQNRDVAMVLGIDVGWLSMVVFGLGTATAGAGGVVLGMVFPFDPQTQIQWLSWAFLVVLFGGLGGVGNTLAGGLTVGVIQALASVLLPFRYVFLVLYGLLAAILIVKGQGLAAVRTRRI
jgi:branched-chain amino acid transport system permease protein